MEHLPVRSRELLSGLIGQEVAQVTPGLEGLVQQILAPQQQGGGGGGGGGGAHVAPSGDVEQFARQLARKKFGGGQWSDLDALVTQESGWNPQADNPTSTAHGLFQFLDSTYANYGGKTNDPYKQIRKGLRYIQDRYGTPENAWDFHQQNNWY